MTTPESLRPDGNSPVDLATQLVTALPDLMFVIDRAIRFVQVTPEDHPTLWMPPSEFIGKRVDEVLPASLAAQTSAMCSQVFVAGEPQVFEYQAPGDGDGPQNAFEARAVALGSDQVLLSSVTSHPSLYPRKRAVGERAALSGAL